MQKDYWERFYGKEKLPEIASSFAKFVSSTLNNNKLVLADVGCGNGRDSKCFEDLGYNVLSVDQVQPPVFYGSNFIQANAATELPDADVYYLRFFVHALKEENLDQLIRTVSKKTFKHKLCIETRSTTGYGGAEKCATNFRSSIGEEHFRMLYSKEYLVSKLKKDYDVIYVAESDEFSPFKGEKPSLIRIIADARSGSSEDK